MNSGTRHNFGKVALFVSAAFLISLLPMTGTFAADKKSPTKNHPTRDMITTTVQQDCQRITVDKKYIATGDNADDGFAFPASLTWDKSLGFNVFYPKLQDDTAYVIHVTSWKKQDDGLVAAGSSWYAYRKDKEGHLKQGYTSTNTGDLPIIYAAKKVELITIQKISADEISDADAERFKKLKLTYTIIPSQGTPEDVANLGKVFAAIFGLQTSGKVGTLDAAPKKGDEAPGNACAEHFSVKGTALLPYDLSIKVGFGGSTPKAKETPTPTKSELSNPAFPETEENGSRTNHAGPYDGAGRVDESNTGGEQRGSIQESQAAIPAPAAAPGAAPADSGGGNNIARTLHVLDKEWWDINLSVAVPGVREPKSSLNKDNVVSASVTRHVDVYGFLSIYPFAGKYPKNSFAPHFNAGLPFAGQPLHRSFVGASEKLPWIEKAVGIPVNVFGGTVFLQEQLSTLALGTKPADTATFTNSLQRHWVRKGMFGLEVSVSALVGKIGKSK